ncbi:MAG: hypothetical protein IPK26_26385 [Planctomycetes bacterium]|nr:hypothetical protein [Planctomycetota bacterium]
MTTVLDQTSPATTTANWNAEFAALKARFPHAKDTIVFCVHALMQSPDIGLDDLKAQAALHGLRVTGASVTAARRLMAEGNAQAPAGAAITAPAAQRQPRRVRAAEPPVDTEALIRQVVGRIQTQGAADSERLKDAVRKAVAILQAAVG